MNLEAAKRLAAATIECTVLDARGQRQADRPAAVAWLASSRAAVWFDILDIDQQYFLEQSEWQEWAREALEDDDIGEFQDIIEATLFRLVLPEPADA